MTSLAALEVLRARDPAPLEAARLTAGLSLGEYTALVFAGALDFDDAVRVVAERGRAMQDCAEAIPGGMVAVLGLERDAVAALCDACRGDGVLAGGQRALPRQHRGLGVARRLRAARGRRTGGRGDEVRAGWRWPAPFTRR